MPFCWFCHEVAHLSLFHQCELERRSRHLSVIYLLKSVLKVVKYNSTVNSQLTVIIPSFRTHRSEEQFDRVYTVYLLFLLKKLLVIR